MTTTNKSFNKPLTDSNQKQFTEKKNLKKPKTQYLKNKGLNAN